MQRKSGILLHITSLPSAYGIGDLGPEAYNFLHFLKDTHTHIWQMLPLHPTGYGDSPYTSYSAFAGNELLISPDMLHKDGLLGETDVASAIDPPQNFIDYGNANKIKQTLLKTAYQNFQENPKLKIHPSPFNETKTETTTIEQEFTTFCNSPLSEYWLTDYALFRSIKEEHDQSPWFHWPTPLRDYIPWEIEPYKENPLYNYFRFLQYLFFRQWLMFKQKAEELGIIIFGDIPIFISYDSADVWSHRAHFKLTPNGWPRAVAGVPPDYFSDTGQLWGNPLYNWNVMKAGDYDWWAQRFSLLSQLVDWIRIDHFRGFEAYWEIPAKEKTAINGKWKKGPGKHFFKTLQPYLENLQIVAEDLGVITPEVNELREAFAFPGMKVLQFAFGGDAQNLYLPHNHTENSIVYTGTHDNDTTLGWYQNADAAVQQHVHDYFGIDGSHISLKMIRYALMSVAHTAIFPMQDLMELSSRYRMNTPAQAEGNWRWRLLWSKLPEANSRFLVELNRLTGRD